VALANPRIRDACLATAVPGTKAARAAKRLWLALVRALPAPERPEPAGLLGYARYTRGEGALAGIAFENALAAHPGHVLASLLITALRHVVAPRRLSGLGRLDGVVDLADAAGD
jgi:hypothetical protein